MSQDTLERNAYRPHILPERGEDLVRGWQYLLTPLVRLILQEKYGYYGVPTVVECILVKTPPMRIQIMRTNLETGASLYSIQETEGQEATFRVYMGVGRPALKFCVNFEQLAELAPMYAESHKLPALEEDWFETRHLPSPSEKLRGCSIRWWNKQKTWDKKENSGIFVPRAKKEKAKVDLSLFL